LPLRLNPVDRFLPDQYASTIRQFVPDGINANRIIVQLILANAAGSKPISKILPHRIKIGAACDLYQIHFCHRKFNSARLSDRMPGPSSPIKYPGPLAMISRHDSVHM